MKYVFLLILSVLSVPTLGLARETSGNFSGSIGQDLIEVDGVCYFGAKGFISFASDRTFHTDENGDGVIVLIVKFGVSWNVDISKDGKTILKGSPGNFLRFGDTYQLTKKKAVKSAQGLTDLVLAVTCTSHDSFGPAKSQ